MKKILDIIPQSPVSVEKRNKKKNRKTKQETKKRLNEQKKQKTGLFPFSGFIFVFGALVFIAGVVFVTLNLQSRLTLTLHYQQEEITITDEIEVDITKTKVDINNKVIPGRFFETQEEKWEIFPSTGVAETGEKAKGVITIYNSHNPPRTVTLVSQTRLLSSGDGKIFRAQEKIYLPPAIVKGGRITPSAVDIKVQAQEAGADYNISPSKFSVPGLAGSPLYYTVWGESNQAMQGGSSGELLKITEDDLRLAKLELAKILKTSANLSLKDKAAAGFIMDDEAIAEEDIETECFREAGDVANEFNCYGKISAKSLAFRIRDLNSIAFGFLEAAKPSSKELKQESQETTFSLKGAVTKAGKMVLNITSKANAYEKINKDILFYEVADKRAEQIRTIIADNFPQIGKVEIKFWPFWIKISPKDTDKININLVD